MKNVELVPCLVCSEPQPEGSACLNPSCAIGPKNVTPRCCETCLYMATHEKCNASKSTDSDHGDCLNTPEDYAAYRGSGRMSPMRYYNWVEAKSPMEQLDRLHAMQVDGRRSIVIGGQGEAEVNAKQTPEECSKQLHDVAEQCGYCVERLRTDGDEQSLVIYTHQPYRIIWKAGRLWRIMRQVYSRPDYPAQPELVKELVFWEAK